MGGKEPGDDMETWNIQTLCLGLMTPRGKLRGKLQASRVSTEGLRNWAKSTEVYTSVSGFGINTEKAAARF